IVKLRSVSWRSLGSDHEPPRASLAIENPILRPGRSQPLVEHHSHPHLLKPVRGHQRPHAVRPTDLLVGHERDVDGPIGHKAGGLEAADGLEVLDPDALHVLRAAGVDVALGPEDGGEGRVDPLVGLGGDDVSVRVEEEGGEGGAASGPLEDEEGLAGDEF
ncbi:hypothetical protein MUK42_00648, partial [Musa troglodytarum]